MTRCGVPVEQALLGGFVDEGQSRRQENIDFLNVIGCDGLSNSFQLTAQPLSMAAIDGSPLLILAVSLYC